MFPLEQGPMPALRYRSSALNPAEFEKPGQFPQARARHKEMMPNAHDLAKLDTAGTAAISAPLKLFSDGLPLVAQLSSPHGIMERIARKPISLVRLHSSRWWARSPSEGSTFILAGPGARPFLLLAGRWSGHGV